MGDQTAIEWADATWNPVTGCTKISLGCTHCYAEGLAARLHAMGNPRYQNGFDLTLHPDQLTLPPFHAIRWTRGRHPGTMTGPMPKPRLMLILVLVAVLDLGGASPPGGVEAFEEFEETAHGRRRLVRLARQPVPPSTDIHVARAAAIRPRPAHRQPLVRAAADAPRRAPTPSPDPASSLDDH